MDFNEGAVRAAPIVGAVGADTWAGLKGLPLHELFYIVTIVYTVVQLALVVYKTVKEERRKDKE